MCLAVESEVFGLWVFLCSLLFCLLAISFPLSSNELLLNPGFWGFINFCIIFGIIFPVARGGNDKARNGRAERVFQAAIKHTLLNELVPRRSIFFGKSPATKEIYNIYNRIYFMPDYLLDAT